MSQSVTTTEHAAEPPVSVAELKTHLRMQGDDGSHDGLFARLIGAATLMVERSINRVLVTRTLRLSLDCWPGNQDVYLPQPPAASVLAITYTDTEGQERIVADDAYQFDAGDGMGRLRPNPGTQWPTVWSSGLAPIRIDYLAGVAPDRVPEDLRAAVLMLAAHHYENTEAAAPIELRPIPYAIDTILDSYRVPIL